MTNNLIDFLKDEEEFSFTKEQTVASNGAAISRATYKLEGLNDPPDPFVYRDDKTGHSMKFSNIVETPDGKHVAANMEVQ